MVLIDQVFFFFSFQRGDMGMIFGFSKGQAVYIMEAMGCETNTFSKIFFQKSITKFDLKTN
jgi:hypothetical protein